MGPMASLVSFGFVPELWGFVQLLLGLVLLPCGIPGTAETNAGDGQELHWELDEELGRMYVTFSTISSGSY